MVAPAEGFPTPKFSSTTEIDQWCIILEEIYTFLCINNSAMRSSLILSGPRPFTVTARLPWGSETKTATPRRGLLNDVLLSLRVAATHDRLKDITWLGTGGIKVHDTRHMRR